MPFSFKKKHPIYKLAYQGKTNKLARYINNNKSLASMRAHDGSTPLLQAATNGQLDTVKWLLNHGANINECLESGATALLLAALKGHLNTVKWLLSHGGAKITECNNAGVTSLICAASKGHLNTVKWLLENGGANIKECSNNNITALLSAASHGHLNTVKWLLENGGANISDRSRQGNSALLFAVGNGHLDIVKWLVNHGGAKISERNMDGYTSLFYAVNKLHPNVVKFLLKQPGHSYSDILYAYDCTLSGEYANHTIKDILETHVNWINQIAEKSNIKMLEELKCPITLQLIKTPVIAPDGRIYEKGAIETWLSNPSHRTSPFSRCPVQVDQLNPCLYINRILESAIKKIEQLRNEHINLSQKRLTVSNTMFRTQNIKSKHNQQKVIPEEFVCPITQNFISNPVVAPDGRIYEKEAIEIWVTNHKASPLTEQPVRLDQLNPCLYINQKMEAHQRLALSTMVSNEAQLQSIGIDKKSNKGLN